MNFHPAFDVLQKHGIRPVTNSPDGTFTSNCPNPKCRGLNNFVHYDDDEVGWHCHDCGESRIVQLRRAKTGGAQTGGIPFMLTVAQKVELRELGYSNEQIRHLPPQEGQDIIAQKRKPPPVESAPTNGGNVPPIAEQKLEEEEARREFDDEPEPEPEEEPEHETPSIEHATGAETLPDDGAPDPAAAGDGQGGAAEAANNSEQEEDANAGNGAGTGQTTSGIASLPVIQIDDGNLHGVIEQAEKAILQAPEQRLFQRAGMLVRLKRIAQKKTIKGITRDAGALIIAEATAECVRLEMARTARYTKWNVRAKKYVLTDPPIKYARAIAAQDDFSFKTLLATIETPTLRPDGSVLQKPGYDEATGLYFDSAQTFPAINSNPSKHDATAALDKIGKVLKDFPFVDGSRAVAIAAILTALVRRVLPAAPMFLFDAPVPASGKSLLSYVVARIATGRNPATQPYTGDSEEDRKRIIATLIAGDSVVSFDNISEPLQDDTLCKVLTQPEVDDRLLGTMTNLRLPTCTTFLGTGVNLVVIGRDMVRRVQKCRIDPSMERPEEREFDYVLLDYVMEHRAELVVAALTIMRAYIAAGRPPQKIKPYGGFEEWDAMVRAPLVWLGCGDPCVARDEVEDADPDTEKLANLLAALTDRFTNEFTVAEVVAMARKDDLNAAAYGTDLTPLYEAVAALCWEGKINPTGVGKAFAKYRGRIVNGRKLTKVGVRHQAIVWKLEIISGCGWGRLGGFGRWSHYIEKFSHC